METTKRPQYTSTMFEERIQKIQTAIKSEDWFSAFTNIVIYFEFYGYWALRNYCAWHDIKLNKQSEDALKSLTATNIALFMRVIELMDENEYSKIRNVIAERNKIVHPGRKGLSYLKKIKKDDAEQVLNEAINCLESFWTKKAWKC